MAPEVALEQERRVGSCHGPEEARGGVIISHSTTPIAK